MAGWLKVALLVVGLLGVAAAVVWWWTGRSLYVPGSLAGRRDLEPPPGAVLHDGLIPVSPDISLRAFLDGPEEAPLTLVIHGGPGIPVDDVWPALHLLSDSRRFLYYQQRGCGDSTRPIERPSGKGYRENLEAVREVLSLEQQIADIERLRRVSGQPQIALVGHSFGAFLAALYAAEFPERVTSLTLIAPADLLVLPSPRGDLFETIHSRLSEDHRVDYDEFMSRYLDFSPALFQQSDAELAALGLEFGDWYRLALEDETWGLPEGGAQRVEQVGGWMTWGIYLSMGRRHDYTAALSRITAPTRIIHADRDLQPVSVSQLYRDHIPGSELVILPDSGHFPQVDAPAALAERLR